MTTLRTSDAGYTLAEALAALLIVGLAIAGLTEGARVVGRMQKPVTAAVAENRLIGRAETELEALLAARAPDDISFAGDAGGFAFNCPGLCSAALNKRGKVTELLINRAQVSQRLRLPPTDRAKLVYDARDGRYDRWPPPSGQGTLKGVAVVGTTAQGEVPLVVAGSWIEQPKTCEFDMVARECRPSGR